MTGWIQITLWYTEESNREAEGWTVTKEEGQDMAYIDNQLVNFKHMLEEAVVCDGKRGKEYLIRSSQLINLIHDAIKYELHGQGVALGQIYPPFGQSKPEIKLAGFLKQKDQDVCVVPRGIRPQPCMINWGPMAFQRKRDVYGMEYSTQVLVINVRSQMSSLAKNADTLFERTFAEALNLHIRYPDIVLGEVYLIPVYEYDDTAMSDHKIVFKRNKTDVEKYISFFHAINNRQSGGQDYMYERCALLVVDFRPEQPRLFRDSAELKAAGIISPHFPIEYATLGFDTFARDILSVYAARYGVAQLLRC